MNGFLLFFLSIFTVVQLNCENFFDCKHDSLKQDTEFLPTGFHHWTPKRYWHKTTHLAQEIVSCGEQNNQWFMPDIIGLCEVENDSCMQTLVRRSPLRTARYEYVMTHSPDVRGINVALLYSPFSFRLISSASIPINVPKNVREIFCMFRVLFPCKIRYIFLWFMHQVSEEENCTHCLCVKRCVAF